MTVSVIKYQGLELELKQARTDLANSNKELEIAFASLLRSHSNAVVQLELLTRSEKMATLGEMSLAIAHEINNPLAILQLVAGGVKDMAEADCLERGVLIQSCDQIEKSILRISKIIRALRSFSRGSEKDPYCATPLKTIVEDVLELSRRKFNEHGIEFRFSEIDQDLQLECRASEISQVLLNLFSNAADAVASLGEKWIELEASSLGDRIRIAVTDSGTGIPTEFQNRLFKASFTTKEVNLGSGLGLGICRRIVEGHQGTISLDAACPHTRFVLDLPKRQKAPLKFIAE